MKISKLLIITLLATCSLMTVSTAKAATTQTTTQSSGLFGGLTTWLNGLFGGSSTPSTTTSTKGGTTGTSLPIDNNVWFLIIAAGVVGCKVIMNKSKETSVQASEL